MPEPALVKTLAQVREVIEGWRKDYNEQRPHVLLGWLTPLEFNMAWQQVKSG